MLVGVLVEVVGVVSNVEKDLRCGVEEGDAGFIETIKELVLAYFCNFFFFPGPSSTPRRLNRVYRLRLASSALVALPALQHA